MMDFVFLEHLSALSVPSWSRPENAVSLDNLHITPVLCLLQRSGEMLLYPLEKGEREVKVVSEPQKTEKCFRKTASPLAFPLHLVTENTLTLAIPNSLLTADECLGYLIAVSWV